MREKVLRKRKKINFQFLLLPKDQKKINPLIHIADDSVWRKERKGKKYGKLAGK